MSINPNYKTAKSIHEFTVKNIKGEDVKLDAYKGHVCIILNVASRCGLAANNYKQLNELYEAYAEEKGLRILAFPCNQFAGQEPGNPEEIVCSISERKVKFDLFEKIKVNGNNAIPLWKFLKYKKGGTLCGFIKWNFTKFIVDKDGVPVERHGPTVDPLNLVKSLEKYCNPDYSRANNLHQFTVENLNGEPVKLDKYKDFIIVIVNVATKSPMTAMNYKLFNELMDKHGDKLRILAFPCNQFGQEEPGSSEEIAAHAEKNNVKFDVFAKVEVNGEQANVVWKYLKHCLTGPPRSGAVVKWSYTKFIIGKDGIPAERIGPEVQLDKFEQCLNRYIVT